MKVVITCKGRTLKDPIDRRFGRCPTFLFVDSDTLDVEAIQNEASSEPVGASIGAAKKLARRHEVEAIITGRLGPNAARILESAGIPVYSGVEGTARQALKDYRSGRLSRAPIWPRRMGSWRRFGDARIKQRHTERPPTAGKKRFGKGDKTGPTDPESSQGGPSAHVRVSRRSPTLSAR